MLRFSLNPKIILSSFLVFNILFALVFEHFGRSYPSLPCDSEASNKTSFSMVSKDFWDAICRHGWVFISSSEGAGFDDFQNIFKTKYNLNFDIFSGQHRGLKTAAYLVSHDIHPDRIKKLKLVVLVNPIYWVSPYAEIDDGAAHQSALSYFSYANRVHLNQHWLNIFGNMALTSKEYIRNYYFAGKSDLEIEDEKKKRARSGDSKEFQEPVSYFDSVGDSEEVLQSKNNFRLNYDLKHGMTNESYSHASDTPYSWHFNKIKEPMTSILNFFQKRTEDLHVDYCLVLLPLNERFLGNGMNQLKDEKENIRNHFSNFPFDQKVDLMDLGDEDYLFKDLMHFTRYGRHLISDSLKNSDCFQKVFGT